MFYSGLRKIYYLNEFFKEDNYKLFIMYLYKRNQKQASKDQKQVPVDQDLIKDMREKL